MDILQDPLDSEEFDTVQYINQRFPTEASLEDLDDFVGNLNSQISSLDEEISRVVQTQSVAGKQASEDILHAKGSIDELFVKIHDIKSKASQSERMVQEICADIKKLDYAKNHLQTSITSLNRLQMLINAVTQLEILAQDYQYREAANLLDAVKQFMSHFEKYSHIAMVADIQARVKEIRSDLTAHIRESFKKVAQLVDSVANIELMINEMPGGMRSLSDSTLVVDALGSQVRRDLLEEFVQVQLVPYENLFGAGKECFSLEEVDRRWAWFKRLLKSLDQKFRDIFPPHWRLPLRMCLEFTERTKIHLVLLLTEMENSDESADVHALLKALQSALRFEQEMSERFNVKELLKLKEAQERLEKQRAEELATHQKLKNSDKLMYIPTDHGAVNIEDETESGFLGLAHSAIVGGISGVFDKFLGSYVLLERQNLEDLLQRLSQEEDTADAEGSAGGGGFGGNKPRGSSGNVYGSSTNMFVFIKNSIKRCTALTTGQSFYSLSQEFRTCMQEYIEMLRKRCPQPQPGQVSGQPPVYRLPLGSEVGVCYMVNTGEYCAEVVPQLEQMIQQKMNPNFASKVDFSSESDAFMDLVAFGLKVLVSGLIDRIEPTFRMMHNVNWANPAQAEEESQYLHICNAVLIDAIPKIRESLSPSYFNNFCTKLATEILARYLDVIMKQKRISDMATQQLLIDTYNLKTLLLQMQGLTSSTSTSASSATTARPSPMYTKLINNKASHIEMILKLLGTPEEMLLERFRIMWPEGQPSDLQALMALKGTKRNDQQVILEMLGLSAAGKMLNKTASNILHGSSGGGGSGSGGGMGMGASVGGLGSGGASGFGGGAGEVGAGTGTGYSAAAAASISMASSSMGRLTQDLSSTARSAVGNLKWSSNK